MQLKGGDPPAYWGRAAYVHLGLHTKVTLHFQAFPGNDLPLQQSVGCANVPSY